MFLFFVCKICNGEILKTFNCRKGFTENFFLCRPQQILWEKEFDDGGNTNYI